MLANGMGGMDWSGLPLQVARFGIADVEGLVVRLEMIATHKPPEVMP